MDASVEKITREDVGTLDLSEKSPDLVAKMKRDAEDRVKAFKAQGQRVMTRTAIKCKKIQAERVLIKTFVGELPKDERALFEKNPSVKAVLAGV